MPLATFGSRHAVGLDVVVTVGPGRPCFSPGAGKRTRPHGPVPGPALNAREVSRAKSAQTCSSPIARPWACPLLARSLLTMCLEQKCAPVSSCLPQRTTSGSTAPRSRQSPAQSRSGVASGAGRGAQPVAGCSPLRNANPEAKAGVVLRLALAGRPLGKSDGVSCRSYVAGRRLCRAHNSTITGSHDHVVAPTAATVALRSSGCWPADVCFHDCDNATRLALTAALVYIPRESCVGAVAWSQPPAANLSKHYVARGSLVLRLAKQHCFCLTANPEPHRPPHHRGDAPVSHARRDEWTSSDAAEILRPLGADASPTNAVARSERGLPLCRVHDERQSRRRPMLLVRRRSAREGRCRFRFGWIRRLLVAVSSRVEHAGGRVGLTAQCGGERKSGTRGCIGGIAEVESNRPKSPAAFDFARSRPAVVWSRSAVCLRIRPSSLPDLCSMPSAPRRARARSGRMSESSQEQVCPVRGFNGSAVLIGVRSGSSCGHSTTDPDVATSRSAAVAASCAFDSPCVGGCDGSAESDAVHLHLRPAAGGERTGGSS